MATLSDIPIVMKSIGWKEFGRRIWQQAGEDDLFTWAASLAYSWIFAVFPFLIFLLTLVPLMPERSRNNAGEQIKSALKNLPENAAKPLMDQVDALLHTTHGGLLSIGLIVSLWAASGGMSMTMTALDRCYDIRDGRSFIRQRFLALLLTMVSTVLIILLMILLPVANAVIKWLLYHGHLGFFGKISLDVARFTAAVLLMLTILALLYHFGPSLQRRFVFITPGAVFSLSVWLLLVVTFNQYINRLGAASYSATYGTVAGVAILLLFFYIDAIVLLIGAEIDSEIDFAMFGLPSTSKDQSNRTPLRPPSKTELELIAVLRKKRRLADASEPVKALADEIKQTEPNPALPRPSSPHTTAPALTTTLQRGLLASGIAALCGLAAWSAAKAARTMRLSNEENERLTRTYPDTYEVLRWK